MSLSRDLIRYLGGLEVTQGRYAGQPFDVLGWQRRFVRGAFRPAVSRAALSLGRVNGKTTLVAGIGAAALDGPLVVRRGETVVVASSFDQGRIAFDHVREFLSRSHNLRDRAKWQIWDSANIARIQNKETGASLKTIGSDPRRAHGLAPVLILADEPAQWESSTAERMVAALTTAAGKQPFYRFFAFGTRPASSEHWFAKMLDGGAHYSQTHAARPDDPKFQRRTWRRANPSFDHMPDLQRAIADEAALAKLNESELAQFDALRLNLGTSDVTQSSLLDVETWKRIEGQAEHSGRPVWGVDLGTTSAMSAVAGYWPESGRLEVLSAFPNEPDLARRGLSDGVGNLYVVGHRRDELIQVGGHAVDVAALVRAALNRFGPPSAIAADRWREGELRDALTSAGVPSARLELRGQGFKDGAADVREFRRGCLEGDVTPIQSLILTYAMAEARTISDAAGNAKLSKGVEGGRRMRARDDAAAAAILAVALGRRRRQRRRSGVYLGAV